MIDMTTSVVYYNGMKKKRVFLKNYTKISVHKGVRKQIQTLAARQNIDVERASEDLIRCGLEIYQTERASGTDAGNKG
jgi:hypothetical protein